VNSNIRLELDRWTALAAAHGHDSWEGKPKSANRAFAKLQLLQRDLEEAHGDAVKGALAPLLMHDDLYVRVAAAVWMLRFDPDLAVSILEELDSKGGGGWHITAHYILEAFRDGTYPLAKIQEGKG
jgi:hypothetical protein